MQLKKSFLLGKFHSNFNKIIIECIINYNINMIWNFIQMEGVHYARQGIYTKWIRL